MMQLCGCDPNDNEIFADPLFVYNADCTGAGEPYTCCIGLDTGTCDYQLDTGSPGIGTGEGGY